MDAQDLLRHRTEDALLQAVELIEATPRADLAQANKQASHGLEVEVLVAVEHQHEPSHAGAERLHALRLAGASRAEGAAAHAEVQRLGQCQVAPVRQRCLHEALANADVSVVARHGVRPCQQRAHSSSSVLETIAEGRPGHTQLQPFQQLLLIRHELVANAIPARAS